ncbi:plasmid pRiA4b ORF-3 family protein [Pseudarthrobacter sp. S9]|uniref:plasmid pRiA4b ORF-3 family protein n=1 Tax=Pseudarthrobacter sp. S9 TaxID=3418421 RepID=UPI003CFD90EC
MAKIVDGSEWILRVRVQLVDSVPGIWRLLELAGSLSLGRVHEILQTAFGWQDAHLHRSTAGDPFEPLRPIDGEIPEALQWVPAEFREEPTDLSEDECSLDELLATGAGAAFYEYDFGDSWLHRLELVTRRRAEATEPPAQLLDGARRGPLEDSGGFPGFEEMLDVLADPISRRSRRGFGVGSRRDRHRRAFRSRVSGRCGDLSRPLQRFPGYLRSTSGYLNSMAGKPPWPPQSSVEPGL